MHVLVLDGNENQAVAAVRSLAAAGHDVTVGAETAWSKAGWSRYARAQLRYTSPRVNAARFVDDLLQHLRPQPGTLLLPMTERTTLPVSAQRERLAQVQARLVLPEHPIVLHAFDKARTVELAESLGIPVPRTHVYTADMDAPPPATYPVVLKPAVSEDLDESGRVQTTGAPVYARNATEFADATRRITARARRFLVQEYVEGTGAGYFALAVHGSVRAEFAHRRIRDVRPTGSGSAVRASAPLDPRIAAAGRRILAALRWHGPAMVEFRRRPDGTAVFMEVNGRFWNSLALAIYAGIDFPRLVAELAERGDVHEPPPYRPDVRCRWLLGDMRHLLSVLRGPPRGYEGAWPSRWRTLRDVVVPVRGTYHDHWRWNDPAPELGDWLHFLLRRLPAHWSRRARA